MLMFFFFFNYSIFWYLMVEMGIIIWLVYLDNLVLEVLLDLMSFYMYYELMDLKGFYFL